MYTFMDKFEADKKADISAVADRHEPVTAMEPLLIGEDSRHRGGLAHHFAHGFFTHGASLR